MLPARALRSPRVRTPRGIRAADPPRARLPGRREGGGRAPRPRRRRAERTGGGAAADRGGAGHGGAEPAAHGRLRHVRRLPAPLPLRGDARNVGARAPDAHLDHGGI
jgi:hypothetical protein